MTSLPDPSSLPDAVVFDCDGTLVDTEPLSDETYRVVLGRRGYTPTPEDFAAILGRPHRESLRYWDARLDGGIGDVRAFEADEREVFGHLFATQLVRFDDAIAVVRELHDAGVPVAVASSSRRRHIERVLVACELTEHVTAIVGAQDTEQHKPHPAPYLAAAVALGVPAERCSAVEDSRVGIASARAAGMWTVAVRRGHVPDTDLADAHIVTDHLALDHLLRSG